MSYRWVSWTVKSKKVHAEEVARTALLEVPCVVSSLILLFIRLLCDHLHPSNTPA